MKKLTTLLLVSALVLSCVGCSAKEDAAGADNARGAAADKTVCRAAAAGADSARGATAGRAAPSAGAPKADNMEHKKKCRGKSGIQAMGISFRLNRLDHVCGQKLQIFLS